MESYPTPRYSTEECDEEPVVSIILPVYRTKHALIERAVSSALGQSRQAVEVLIIDDGSSAETASFIDHLAAKDARVRAIHQANRGVSSARNRGLAAATGDYVAFLDADDYLLPNFVDAGLELVRHGGAQTVFGAIALTGRGGGGVWRSDTSLDGCTSELASPDCIVKARVMAVSASPDPHGSTSVLSVTNVVGALYEASIAREVGFRVGVSHAEDRLFNFDILNVVERVVFSSEAWYVYDRSGGGVTEAISNDSAPAIYKTVREFVQVAESVQHEDLLDAALRTRLISALATGAFAYLRLLLSLAASAGRRSLSNDLFSKAANDPEVVTLVGSARVSGIYGAITRLLIRWRLVDLTIGLVRLARSMVNPGRPEGRRGTCAE